MKKILLFLMSLCRLLFRHRNYSTIYDYKDETTLINAAERQPVKDGKFFDLQGRQLTAQPTQINIFVPEDL